MSLNFIQVPAADWIGQVSGQATNLCAPMASAPRIVPIKIDWSLYPTITNIDFGVRLNMEGTNVVNELDRIVSVYIDNLGSPTPMYVWFPDTGFTAVAGPGAAGWMPVITNQRKASVYGLGFVSGRIPVTTVHFCNFFVPPSGGLTSGSADTPPALTPLIASYIGNVIWDGNTATPAFDATSFGPLSLTNRHLLIAVSGTNLNGDNRQITGISAAASPMAIVNSTGLVRGPIAVGLIADNTNVAGIIGATFTNAVTRAIAHIYTIENLINETPISAPAPTNNSGATLINSSTSLSIPARGAGFVFSGGYDPPGLGAGLLTLNSFNGLPLDGNIQNRPGATVDFRLAAAANEFVLSTPSLQVQTQWSVGQDGSTGNIIQLGVSFGPN